MPSPFNKRPLALGAVAFLLVVLIARWISGWGLVTIHVKDAPLSQVIASIARQGHVSLESSLDPTKPVSLDVDRVPVAEAIDELAIRADASWRLVYLAAPTESALKSAKISLGSDGTIADWTTYYYPLPPFAESFVGATADPRALMLSLEGSDRELSLLLNQAAQKSGVMTAFPKDWTMTVSQLPKEGQVRKTIPSLIKIAHGKSAEFFLLTEKEHHRGGPPGEAPPPNDQAVAPNPEWIEARQNAQIALLPPERQAEAKKSAQEHKAFVQEMKQLSPEERRARMSNPDFQDKIADRMLLHDAKLSAQQRITRALNYLNRKAAAQASQGR